MFANYSSSTPVVNNYGNIVTFWEQQDLIKLKEIGGDGISWPIEKESTPCVYKGKKYFTTSVSLTFSSWTFEQFEEQYRWQIALMEEAIQFLKTIKQPYKIYAENQTRGQYYDLFFHDNFAFLVADIYTFFNGRWDVQSKNQELFKQVVKDASKTEEYQELKEIEIDNLDFLTDEADDEEKMKWAPEWTPVYHKKNEKGVVQISVQDIIDISGYSFSPIIRWEPTYIEWQERVIYDTNRFITIVGSRQGWKSHVMALRALVASFKWFRHDTLVCAFLTETTWHIYKYLTRLIENFPEGTFVESKQKGWITNTMTWSRIIFRSLSKEADRIRWWTLNEIIMDECYLIWDEIFESVLLPTLSTTGGSVCMISTPGPKNWFYWEVMKWKMGEPGHSYYQFTINDNPFIVPEERARILKRQHDPVIRREWFCEFDDLSNQVFRPERTGDIVFFNNHRLKAFFVVAYDPARKGKDRAAYCVYMVYDWQVFGVKSWAIPDSYKSTWEWQAKWLKENILAEFPDYYFVMDSTGMGDGPVSIFQNADINVYMAVTYTSGNTETEDETYPYGRAKAMRVGKSRLINNTQNYLDEGTAKFYKYTNELLFFEMDGITEKRTSMGHVGFTTKWFDDITNTAMLGLYLIETEWLLYKKRIVQEEKKDILSQEPYFQSRKKSSGQLHGNIF